MAKHQLLTAIACTLALVAAAPAPMAEPVVGLRLVKRAPQAEEAEDPIKLDLTAKFNEQVALQGGNIQQDTTFPPGQNGVLEIEFSNADGRTLTVAENKNPAPPPAGFVALEPVSYVVQLSGGSADGLTVSKVDYIQSQTSNLDISKGQIGQLCTKTNTFMIGANVGELEFEAEEKELSLSVANMNSEWGIFLPQAAAGTAASGATNATAGVAAGTGKGSKKGAGGAGGAAANAAATNATGNAATGAATEANTGAANGASGGNTLVDLLTSLLSRVGASGGQAA